MYKLLKYLRFLLSSSNQHGVHSPFVYHYVTECLYAIPQADKDKSLDVLLKSIRYFRAERIWLTENNDDLKILVLKQFPGVTFGDYPFDLLFMDAPNDEAWRHICSLPPKIHNDSVLLIDEIHKNKANEYAWEQYKKHERVTVTVDMYHLGAVFFRSAQAREHFKIRI